MASAISKRPDTERATTWASLVRGLLDMPDLPHLFEFDRIRVEEVREDDEVVVRAEVPGIDPDEDIELTVDDGVLGIRVHRERREEATDDDRVRTEFQYGTFVRRVPLAPGVTGDDITATYTDGILEIRARVPEIEEPEPRQIPITRA